MFSQLLFGIIGALIVLGCVLLFGFIVDKIDEWKSQIAFSAVDNYRRNQTMKECAALFEKWKAEHPKQEAHQKAAQDVQNMVDK